MRTVSEPRGKSRRPIFISRACSKEPVRKGPHRCVYIRSALDKNRTAVGISSSACAVEWSPLVARLVVHVCPGFDELIQRSKREQKRNVLVLE